MICEHWTDDPTYLGEDANGGDVISLPSFFTDPKNAWQLIGLKPCCKIEGKTWEDVMTKYHEHMGFEPYVGMDDP
jgi:hypothetical protein